MAKVDDLLQSGTKQIVLGGRRVAGSRPSSESEPRRRRNHDPPNPKSRNARKQQSTTGFRARSIERHRQLYELTLHEIYKARTRLSLATIARFGEETLVFDAERAVRHGIIDRIGNIALGRSHHLAAR